MPEQTNEQKQNTKSIRRNAALFSLLVLVPFLALMALSFGNDPHAVPSMLEGRKAPEFSLQTLDEETMTLEQLKGKPVVINFWASWCAPCQIEHEHLQRTAQLYGDKVQFLGIIYQDELTNIRDYLSSRTNYYPQLTDPESQVAIDFGVAGVPETFFIDANGQIREKHARAVSSQMIRDIVDPLVLESRKQ